MFDRKTIWLLLFLLTVFGSSSAHAFLGKNRVEDFFSQGRNPVRLNGPASRTGAGENPHYHYETALSNPEARYFNPLIRRFVNSDPARDAWNWFAYANGNPASYVDPSGLAANLANNSGIGNLQSLGFSANEGSSILATTGVLTAPFIFEGTTGAAVTASAAPVAAALPVLLISGDSPQAANGNYGTQNPISGMIDYATFVIGSILNQNSNNVPEDGSIIYGGDGGLLPVPAGGSITGSPDGQWIQVRDPAGNPTGDRIDGGHPPTTHPDPRAQGPHVHRPGVQNPDGTPWLPVN